MRANKNPRGIRNSYGRKNNYCYCTSSLNYKKAGKIIFLDQGKVTGEGTHAELMQNHEKYHQFVTTQNLTE